MCKRLPEPSGGDLRLLTSEVVANAVLHSGMTGADEIVVEAVRTPDEVRVEVTDTGPGFNPAVVPKLSGGNGLGLRLVERLADR